MMQQALQRHNRQQWHTFLHDMAQIDQAAKGSLQACPWSLLEILCMRVAGIHMMGQH